MKALEGAKVALAHDPNALRAAVQAFFEANDAEWEVRAQLAIDLERTPLDHPNRLWKESDAPFQPVVRLVAAKQKAWTEARAAIVDNGMGFSPWNGVEAHRPLGPVMRIRKLAYARSQAFRLGEGTPVLDKLADVPD